VICAGCLRFVWHNNDISDNNNNDNNNNNNINNNNNNNNNNIRISIMLVFMRDGSRSSAVSIFCWFYRFKVVIREKDYIIFDKLTILFLINYSDLGYGVYNKSCKISFKYFNIIKEIFIVYKLYC